MSVLYTCKKAENCFANAKSFHYILSSPIDDAMLEQLQSWGVLTVKRNFRRPFFVLEMEGGVRVKGILQDVILKTGFHEERWEEEKQLFEQRLQGMLETLEGEFR